MDSLTGAKTRLCENCKKDIPMGNFTIHEIHCKRNIDVCTFCREPFPKSDMEAHIDTEHAQVLCKCNMKMEKRHLETHKVSACPLRPAQCQYCELELAHSKVCDHEDYCGTRTESCSSCGRNVMVKDLQAHPTVCGKVTVAPKINCERLLSRYNHRSEDETWFDSLTTRNYLDEDPVRPQARLPRPFQSRSRYYKNEGEERRRAHRMQVDSNLANDIMLPCEFCEELIPEEHLIVHQTGCNPGTIVNSFTKRSPPPFHEFDYDGQLRTFLDQTSDPLNNRFAMLSDQSSSQTEGNIIIPCEFCGIPLENDNLFHHQDQCDLRPCTAVPTTRLWETPVLLPKKDNLEKSKSPQRRVRHQGDVTPSILDEPESIFTSPSGVFSITRTSQHKPSNTASDGAQLNSHLINKTHVDRVPMSHNGKPSTLQAPAAESTTNRQHDHSVQDFSGGSPTRRTTR